ncbi:hypothetical protein SteCoe_14613 [Stentor coeruleus]|uniref:3-hydroxyacyl-CoA dehydrogenase n=1 Tax=Stentor coeruleus TaxID=5963 RepID=A0A1R2C5K7_9CILI|nr:hypothetical protein SteCoe_14613 [Stentor coeruleus]
MKILDSVSVVTGGASGLGESVVRLFHSLGGKIAIWDMNAEQGQQIVKELGGNVIFCQVDVASEASVKSAIDSTLKVFGQIHILLNCAGIILGQRTITSKSSHSLADFERVIKVNLVGTFNTSRLVAKQMSSQTEIDKERGVIVHVSSIAGYEGQRGQAAYGSSKGGILGLTLPMARDLASYGIRVNSVAPGLFGGTRMSDKIDKKVVEGMAKDVPLKRFGSPPEFAHTCKFLVENTYMTGSVVRVDGGLRLPNL